jgi:hypothetical protein
MMKSETFRIELQKHEDTKHHNETFYGILRDSVLSLWFKKVKEQ